MPSHNCVPLTTPRARAWTMLACITSASFVVGAKAAEPPKISDFKLPNDIRVVVLHVAGSKHASIFTFLPMGLAADEPDHTQWAHLVEHLVIRSTVPLGSQEANAETLPDHMRLDFYGSVDNWREGLSHHARWLKGVPFSEAILDTEKRNANAECDFVSKNLATHKFAMAAWGQSFRHGKEHAAVKGDVNRATLAQIQAYRDNRLVRLENTVVCIVGGVDAASAETVLREQFGAIQSTAQRPKPVQLKTGKREMTWDLDARHLVLAWPAPSVDKPEYAALELAARWLMAQCYQDAELQKLVGMTLCGADLSVPEGSYFYISASLRPGSEFDAVQSRIESHLAKLRTDLAALFQIPAFGFQLAHSLTKVPDPAVLRTQAPSGIDPKLIEGQLGLTWGMNEFRYGSHRAQFAKHVAATNAAQVQSAAIKYLDPGKGTACRIRPGELTR